MTLDESPVQLLPNTSINQFLCQVAGNLTCWRQPSICKHAYMLNYGFPLSNRKSLSMFGLGKVPGTLFALEPSTKGRAIDFEFLGHSDIIRSVLFT